MAGIYQSILSALGGPLEVGLKDYQHASLAFRSNNYAYAPKLKFLFHTYFEINTAAITQATQPNYGVLVQDIKLPSYSFDTETLNQYNRKRIIQTKIKYNPVSITFLDDNDNNTAGLWHAYYTYYYGDGIASASLSPALNRRDIYDNDLSNSLPQWGYNGDPPRGSASKIPFFNTIKIFGFHQKQFICYVLINPMISEFSHDTYAYGSGGDFMKNTCTIQYESVAYYEGSIDGNNPENQAPGFGRPGFYDLDPSPLSGTVSAAARSFVAGNDGLVAGGFSNPFGSDVFGDAQDVIDSAAAQQAAADQFIAENAVFDQATTFDTGLVDAFTGEAITTTRNTQFAIESQTMTTSTYQAGSLTPGATQTTVTELTVTTTNTAGTQVGGG